MSRRVTKITASFVPGQIHRDLQPRKVRNKRGAKSPAVPRVELVRCKSGNVFLVTEKGNITGWPYDQAIDRAKKLLGVSLLDVNDRTVTTTRV